MGAVLIRALLAIALTGCFSPKPQEGFACGPGDWCPDPLHCGSDGKCRRTDLGDGGPTGDGSIDGDATKANLAFVANIAMTPAAVGGPVVADAMCTQLAHTAQHDGTYVAWISTQGDPAFLRLGSARGWLRPDGAPFADTIGDLLVGRIFHPLRIDQHGNDVGTLLVMTATDRNGLGTGDDCVMWTSTTSPIAIELGVSDGTTGQWTVATEGSCDQAYAMYCLQKDHELAVAPTPASGPLAFVTTSPWLPSGGLSAADGVCAADAHNNNLNGTFLAFLATRQATAISRFQPLPVQPWVRVDGVATTRDFVTWDAPINVSARGDYLDDVVFSGAMSPSVLAANGGEDCNDWVANASGSRVGSAARASTEAFGGAGVNSCTAHHFICLQQ